jgi:hypothetical protein
MKREKHIPRFWLQYNLFFANEINNDDVNFQVQPIYGENIINC